VLGEIKATILDLNCSKKWLFKKYKKTKYKRIRRLSYKRRLLRLVHWAGYALTKTYNLNKNVWYTQKKNCLLSQSLEKKYNVINVSFQKKIIMSKI